MNSQKMLSVAVAVSLTAAIVCGIFTTIFLLTNHTPIEYNLHMGYVTLALLLTSIALMLQLMWKKVIVEKHNSEMCEKCHGHGYIET